MRDVKLKELMVSPVVSVQAEEDFKNVEAKFRTRGIRHLPVVDNMNHVVGLITQRDLYRIISPRHTEDGYVYDPSMLTDFVLSRQMTASPHTLMADDPVSKALDVMIRNKYGCIPIVNTENKLVGIVTSRDILKWAASQLA